MFECPVNHPALPGLFDPHIPNNPALWAVFQGRHTGRALVDDLEHPFQCVLRTDAVLTYASRQVSKDFLSSAIAYFQQSSPLWLIRSQGDPAVLEGSRIMPRLEFYDVDPHSPVLAEFRRSLPDEYNVRQIDRALLERCEWRDDMAFYCGSLENFLHHGLGICLMRGEEIIVETYASAFGPHYAEIGALTHESYRGKGFAPITVAYLLEELEQRGYHAYWSCDVDNPASARVARKLGFNLEKPYEIWGYKNSAL